MTRIEINRAHVRDDGYGLWVDGTPLDKIISTALGTRAGGLTLTPFKSDCCDIVITITPAKASKITISGTETSTYTDLKKLEEDLVEQFNEKTEETATEE